MRLILSLALAIILNKSATPLGALVAEDHQNSRWCKEIAPSNPTSIVASTGEKKSCFHDGGQCLPGGQDM